MKWYITGDCHGRYTRFEQIKEYETNEVIGIICLGDFGINFYLNKNDRKMKKWLCEKYSNFIFYLVRGNHEVRPEKIPNIEWRYDDRVKNYVWVEIEFPNIRYLLDGGLYSFGNYQCLCIGGAYSVDKWYRLKRAGLTEETNIPQKSGWFQDEQLTTKEMLEISYDVKDLEVDFVFTHTSPLSYEPSDLFLNFVDQSTVDKSMEKWLDEIKEIVYWNTWCFGHYHADRIERPHVEQYFNDIEELDVIYERWDRYDRTNELDWWLNKSPNFYMI